MLEYFDLKNEFIVCGYIKDACGLYVPRDIVRLVDTFYDKIMIFNVYNNTRNIINNCRAIGINSESYFFINKNNRLFVTGYNEYGELGINESITNIDIIYKHPYFNENNNVNIISNGIGSCHSFIYSNNILYGFGWNLYDQLGIETNDYSIISPLIIEYNFNDKLIQICCGNYHSLFLTNNGNIFGCGTNSYGQLSNEFNESEIGLQNILNNNNIIVIKCCTTSSYILSNDNILYSFGGNFDGELGINNKLIESTKDILPVLYGNNIYKFSCGSGHIGCLTDNNELYMFGQNEFGQCGYKGIDRCHIGNNITLNCKSIIDIKCGHSLSIIKSNDHQFYGFGWNKNGMLFIDDNIRYAYNPTLIKFEYLYKITKSQNVIIDIVPSYADVFIIQKA